MRRTTTETTKKRSVMNLNATLLGQSITFAIFVWFCMKYIWPMLGTAMRERQEAIAAGLRASEEADQKLASAATNAESEMAAAKEEASEIIEQARSRANQMVEEAKDEARQEGQRILDAAKAEIDQEMNRAKEALRADVAALVIAGAERVIEDNIDASKHDTMLTKLASEL
jgi:F-type H+-transporting ATPase subunit b